MVLISPRPCFLPWDHVPENTSPLAQKYLPFPWISSSWNSPSYLSLLAKVRTPKPCFCPLYQSPSYRAPERKKYLPNPEISSSTKRPSYFSPLEQLQIPQPFFSLLSIQPSQQSPLLQLILNLLVDPAMGYFFTQKCWSTPSDSEVSSGYSVSTSYSTGSACIRGFGRGRGRLLGRRFRGYGKSLGRGYIFPMFRARSSANSWQNSVKYWLNFSSPTSALPLAISISSIFSPSGPSSISKYFSLPPPGNIAHNQSVQLNKKAGN